MTTVKRQLKLKLIALLLVITIFATLLPQRMVFWAEESDIPQMISPEAEFDFPDNSDSDSEPERTNRSDIFDEYEQLALEELGKPAIVEDIDPYRRSDVTYELRNIENAFTRNYALKSGNYTRLIFGRPVNYKTNYGQWRKINLSLEKEGNLYRTKDTPYSLNFSSRGADDIDILKLDHGGILLAMSPVSIATDSVEPVYSPVWSFVLY